MSTICTFIGIGGEPSWTFSWTGAIVCMQKVLACVSTNHSSKPGTSVYTAAEVEDQSLLASSIHQPFTEHLFMHPKYVSVLLLQMPVLDTVLDSSAYGGSSEGPQLLENMHKEPWPKLPLHLYHMLSATAIETLTLVDQQRKCSNLQTDAACV